MAMGRQKSMNEQGESRKMSLVIQGIVCKELYPKQEENVDGGGG